MLFRYEFTVINWKSKFQNHEKAELLLIVFEFGTINYEVMCAYGYY